MTEIDIHSSIYTKLLALIPNLHNLEPGHKVTVSETRDLHFEVQERTSARLLVTLTQYVRIPSLGALPGPRITIAVYGGTCTAELICYESFIKRKKVYSDINGEADLKAKLELNAFLDGWLSTLQQEHHPEQNGRE